MSANSPVIMLFRLSREEFPEGIRSVQNYLKEIGEQPEYFFRKKTVSLPVGSKIVFSIENQAVGEAKTASKTEDRPGDKVYKAMVRLDPQSILLYDKHPVIPKTIRGRLFKPLKKQEYDRIRRQTEIRMGPRERKRTAETARRYEITENSREHTQLEKILRRRPEIVEQGLRFIEREYRFPTGDRIDLIFKDSTDRYVTVEIEPRVGKGDMVGLLQALKYRSMFMAYHDLDESRVRGLLVATRIHNSIRQHCSKYGIEAKEVRIAR
jgi:hypothetical protein